MNEPTPAAPTKTLDWYVDRYIRLRDKIAELDAARKAELKPYREALGNLEGIMLQTLNEQGAESLRTAAGTVYKSTQTSATVNRWSETLAYIQAKEAWELLEARVSKTAVMSIMQETGEPIPGVVLRQEETLNVRRPIEKVPT